jgi:hypothetical protein
MTRMTRMMRLTAIGAVFMAASGNGNGNGIGIGIGIGSGGQSLGSALVYARAAATSYRLASAQVVTSTVLPPVLKLTASGPIAFQTLPADANGEPAGPGRVIARLFGVASGDIASFGDLAPFALTVTAAESANATDVDTIVTITTGAITSGQTLVLRAGMKSNEIEAAIVSAPSQ